MKAAVAILVLAVTGLSVVVLRQAGEVADNRARADVAHTRLEKAESELSTLRGSVNDQKHTIESLLSHTRQIESDIKVAPVIPLVMGKWEPADTGATLSLTSEQEGGTKSEDVGVITSVEFEENGRGLLAYTTPEGKGAGESFTWKPHSRQEIGIKFDGNNGFFNFVKVAHVDGRLRLGQVGFPTLEVRLYSDRKQRSVARIGLLRQVRG